MNNKEYRGEQSFINIALSGAVVIRAMKVTVLVGTILAFINHGEKILGLSLTGEDYLKVVLTYLVPYGVSTWSAVAAIRASASSRV